MKIRKNDELLGLVRVKVIGSSGEVLGEMNAADALRLAQDQGLDLVEVNPKVKPPVCKILNLGEFTDPVKVLGEGSSSKAADLFLAGILRSHGNQRTKVATPWSARTSSEVLTQTCASLRRGE